jgi:alcohol dehydrogenase class IV
MVWAIKKVFIRIFQFVFYYFAYLLRWREPELLEGNGSIRKLPKYIKSKKIKKVLIVTDKGIVKLNLMAPLLEELEKEGIEYIVFDNVEPNPKIDNIEAALAVFKENGCEATIAVGGGSSIDTAKAMCARLARPKKSVEKLGGLFKVLKRIPPLYAVPTTAGTGSEATIASVVTNRETKHKYAINDLSLIPHAAVLDPELTIGLPPFITATTGMDALTHAVEAYITVNVPKKCKNACEKAVNIVFNKLEKVYADGKDIEARKDMLYASYLSGMSFTRCGLTYVHPIAHTLGGLYNVPHGLANAVILPYCLEYYGAQVQKKLAALADAAGITTESQSEKEKSDAFIAGVRRLNKNMGIPEKFDCIKKEDIPQMIKWALHEAHPIYQSPVLLNAVQLEEIILKIIA